MKKKVERLEDINVMEGIDFKLNQKLMRANDRARQEYIKVKRKEQFNKKLYKTLTITAIILVAIVLIIGFIKTSKEDKTSIENCMNKGYSQTYCEKTILGL